MLAAIIENTYEKEMGLIYIDEPTKRYSGFKIKDKQLQSLNQEMINLLTLFQLSKNQKHIGQKDEYDVILDLDTNLYHYIKNGKEDFEKLYFLNGENATVFIEENSDKENHNKKDKLAKKFKFSKGIEIFIISLDMFLGLIAMNKMWKMLKYMPDTYINTFVYELEKSKYSYGITAESIKSEIFNSPNLDEIEKEFLWNEELIEDFLPYYQGTEYYDFLIRMRHHNIDIKDFTPIDVIIRTKIYGLAGYYSFDNNLHCLDYDSTQLQDSYYVKLAGHEYAHLLQVNDDLRFITEAEAELIAHEYFLSSADFTYPFSYSNHCKYLKVLMEIISPEVIKDRVHREESTAIEEAVMPYFSEPEYEEFMAILRNAYDNPNFKRLEELLGILYKNKFNADMNDNKIIQAILNSSKKNNFNRAYFRRSLMLSSPSFYAKTQTFSLEEAYKNNLVEFYSETEITKEQYDEFSSNLGDGKSCYCYYSCYSNEVISINPGEKTVILKDKNGNTYSMDLDEAIKYGYVGKGYCLKKNVTFEEYLQNRSKYIINRCFPDCEWDENGNLIQTEVTYIDEIIPLPESTKTK